MIKRTSVEISSVTLYSFAEKKVFHKNFSDACKSARSQGKDYPLDSFAPLSLFLFTHVLLLSAHVHSPCPPYNLTKTKGPALLTEQDQNVNKGIMNILFLDRVVVAYHAVYVMPSLDIY